MKPKSKMSTLTKTSFKSPLKKHEKPRSSGLKAYECEKTLRISKIDGGVIFCPSPFHFPREIFQREGK